MPNGKGCCNLCCLFYVHHDEYHTFECCGSTAQWPTDTIEQLLQRMPKMAGAESRVPWGAPIGVCRIFWLLPADSCRKKRSDQALL